MHKHMRWGEGVDYCTQCLLPASPATHCHRELGEPSSEGPPLPRQHMGSHSQRSHSLSLPFLNPETSVAKDGSDRCPQLKASRLAAQSAVSVNLS